MAKLTKAQRSAAARKGWRTRGKVVGITLPRVGHLTEYACKIAYLKPGISPRMLAYEIADAPYSQGKRRSTNEGFRVLVRAVQMELLQIKSHRDEISTLIEERVFVTRKGAKIARGLL